MQESNKTTIIVICLVIGVLVGGIIGYMMGNNMKKDDEKNNTSQQMDKGSDGVTVGGAKMVATKDIVDNAVNAKNVTTTVDLVKQAGLVETLKSAGPFTVFAPTNDAFAAVPKDILDKVAGNNELLKTVLTYHVLPGTYTTASLRAMAAKGESVTTVQGGMLTFKMVDGNVAIVDATGQEVQIETPDVISTNGVTHVIKNVLLPVDPSTL